MEIRFAGVSYLQNKGQSNERVLLDNISYNFKEEEITMVCGSVDSIIGKLLVGSKRVSKGSIVVGSNTIKSNNTIDKDAIRKDIGFVGHTMNKNVKMKYVYDELKYYYDKFRGNEDLRDDRIKEALTIVGLNSDYLYRLVDSLSYVERKRVNLAAILVYNPKVIILDNFEKGFNDKEKKEMKKLISNLHKKYHKQIIVISNDLEFALNFVDKVVVINKGKIVYDGIEWAYDEKLYKYMEMPRIVEFVKYIRSLGRDILPYTDNKELLKAIYRDVV